MKSTILFLAIHTENKPALCTKIRRWKQTLQL